MAETKAKLKRGIGMTKVAEPKEEATVKKKGWWCALGTGKTCPIYLVRGDLDSDSLPKREKEEGVGSPEVSR